MSFADDLQRAGLPPSVSASEFAEENDDTTLGDGRFQWADISNGAAAIYNWWDNLINQSERDFQQSSAREAMRFEAEQAAIDREFQQSSAERAMQFESTEAQKARDYETMMSNTAYQRAVNDAQAAGINPLLMYQQGGASTPSAPSVSGFSASGSSAKGIKAGSGRSALANIASQIAGNTAMAILYNYDRIFPKKQNRIGF